MVHQTDGVTGSWDVGSLQKTPAMLAGQLESSKARHTCIVQFRDFTPGQSFTGAMRTAMDQADCTLALFSRAYFQSNYCNDELNAALTAVLLYSSKQSLVFQALVHLQPVLELVCRADSPMVQCPSARAVHQALKEAKVNGLQID